MPQLITNFLETLFLLKSPLIGEIYLAMALHEETTERPASLEEVFEQEKEQIRLSRHRRIPHAPKSPEQPIGLALSGGGIRSATFNLGLLQSFATHRLLHCFDYLSTVSGGAYIGSWLMGWMHNKNKGIQQAEAEFGVRAYEPLTDNERPPVRFLRHYSRYLSPQTGLFSADVWTLAATYFRNTTLNFVIFSTVIALLLLLPRWIATVCFWSSDYRHVFDQPGWGMLPVVSLSLGSLFAILAVGSIGRNLANVPLAGESLAEDFPRYMQQQRVQIFCVIPLVAACAFYCIALHSALQYNEAHFGLGYSNWNIVELKLGGILLLRLRLLFLKLFLSGMALYSLFFAATLLIASFRIHMKHRGSDRMRAGWTRAALSHLAYWAIPASITTGFMLLGIEEILNRIRHRPEGLWLILSIGTFLLLAAVQITAIFHIGMIGRRLPDELREWSARLGAWVMIYSLLWLISFAFVVYIPILIEKAVVDFPNTFWVGSMGWLTTTVFGVIAARKLDMPKNGSPESRNERLPVRVGRMLLLLSARTAPFLFIIGILGLFAFGIANLSTMSHLHTLWPAAKGSTRGLLALTAACSFAAAFFGWRIDVNQFSMHSLYRNRLIRCYLGASRDRKPQPFTALDPEDDIPLAEFALHDGDQKPGWPYLIINAALNVVKGKDALALQSRKAKSFIFTPIYCGYDKSKYAPVALVGRAQRVGAGMDGAGVVFVPAFSPTQKPELAVEPIIAPESYGLTKDGGSLAHNPSQQKHRGLSLGTAVAISGAAASPNMGYHTSAATAFLLSLLNIRLGWWIGNPAYIAAWRRGTPRFGLRWLLAELFGNTTDEREFLHLSDGGHFENLGIYELVRRRCSLIVISDATADPDYRFVDLANAIERCRTDFAVNIKIPDLQGVDPVAAEPKSYLIGSIDYGNNVSGVLIYIKPVLLKDLPIDVREYSRAHQFGTDRFPQQSTIDQFFGELQFESYRMLGTHIGDGVAWAVRRELIKALGAIGDNFEGHLCPSCDNKP